MPSIDQLRNRARSLSDEEFVQIAWLKELTADERAYVRAEMLVTVAQPGDYVVRFGKPVTFWFGLIDGLLKIPSNVEIDVVVDIALIQIGQNPTVNPPRAVIACGSDCKINRCTRWQIAIGVDVVVQGNPNLFEIIPAMRPPCRFPCFTSLRL